ncbi:hypothetical protein B0T25DRAFT_570474 [Lasiosphaeria hispida]|uniref:RZ-type domain-containing protein n=1 Tax=Lasiosphaeria hispida TaxID=260671 RepID=A0AAJ0HFF5_9PEZI|nr:hypothetical protein B0T25DRAFT_570474 [Lasiosphaeria hispida]
MRSANDKKARRPRPRRQRVDWDSDFTDSDEETDPLNIATLTDNEDFLYMRLQLIDPKAPEISQALQWYQSVGPSSRRYLVEFPRVLLASFKDTLAALQQIYKQPNVPFRDILAPSEGQYIGMNINPPRYARRPGFEFDLGCLTRGETSLTVHPKHPPDPEEITSQTRLDPTQSVALVNILSRELSLIQGPPGTAQFELFAGRLGLQSSGSAYTDGNPSPTSPTGGITKADEKPLEELKAAAVNHIAQARALLDEYPSTAALKDELDAVELMVNNGVFYREVSKEEIRAVYKAMGSELPGTGHWYTCENGHPFTIGDCGMPMELARCTECNVSVGGHDHQVVQVVRHAVEIEALGSGVGGLRL